MANSKAVKFFCTIEARRYNAKGPYTESDATIGRNTRRPFQLAALMKAVQKLIDDGFDVRLSVERDD